MVCLVCKHSGHTIFYINQIFYDKLMKKILSLLLSGLSLVASAQTMPTLSVDGVDLYMSVQYKQSWDNADVFREDSAGIYRTVAGQGGLVCVKAPVLMSGGIAYHDGKVYTNSFNSNDGGMGSITPEWRIYDLATGELEESIPGEADYGDLTGALTYDVTEDVIYGVRLHNGGSTLARIDPATGEKTDVGNLREVGYPSGSGATGSIQMCPTIAVDRYGEIYAIYVRYPDMSGTLRFGRIAKSGSNAGAITYIGDISPRNMLDGDYILMNDNNEYSLFYNFKDDKMYWMFNGISRNLMEASYTPIFEMNLSSAVATMVGYLPGGYSTSGAFFNEPLLDSPDGVVGLEYEYSESSADRTMGNLVIELPSKTYIGDDIEGTLTLVVTEGETEVARIENLAPGSTVRTDETTFPYGEHTYTTYTISADGIESLKRDFDVFVGYDVPLNPTNVTLSADGKTMTLSWTAPTGGTHGGEIANDAIRYRINSYIDGEVLYDNYEGTSVTIPAADELTRYSYVVYSKYGDNVGLGMTSNALIVGDPLDLDTPYSTDFYDIYEMFNHYKILDVNGDGHTWMWYGGMAMYIYNETQDADDWMFTPPINYIGGHTYKMSVTAMSSSLEGYLESMEVTFGNDDEIEAQQVLETIAEIPTLETTYSYEVTPTEDGVYFFGLHVISPRNHEYLGLTGLEIRDITGSGIDDVAADDDAFAAFAGDDAITVRNTTGETATIYSIGGMVMGSSAQPEFTTAVAPGAYIVKCGTQAVKVIVR